MEQHVLVRLIDNVLLLITVPQLQPGQTKSLCCPSKNFVCSQPRDVGVRCSSTRITRWYFNADSKTCQTFEYNGCEGQLKSIIYTPLILIMHAALCPASSTPFISALSLQPMQCTPNVDGACPGNFFCWFSTTTTSVNAFYCCRSPDSVDTGCESSTFAVASNQTFDFLMYVPHNLLILSQLNLLGIIAHVIRKYARTGTHQSCPDNSACLYTGNDNGFICCRVQLGGGGKV
uniref:BPTI/Kunitz inhibitor domain-containing protein n=1 Tax=Heterorhabditis bacteriophora TaxID=37862 RepID=A0A1I7XP65_HETBA